MTIPWRPKRLRCFFMHIPKTAGMSMRAFLAGQYEAGQVMPATAWDRLADVGKPLGAYRLYAGHFRQAFHSLIPRDTFAFTFLRDPAERTISHLRHLRRDPSFNALHEQVGARDLRALLEDPHILLHCANIQTRYLASAGATRRRRDLQGAPEEAILAPEDVESAEANLDALSFVGFVDDYADDVARMAAKLGLHPPDELPRVNTADPEPPADAELLEMARHANAADYRLYDSARRKRTLSRAAVLPRGPAVDRLVERGFYPVIRDGVTFPLDGPLPASGLWEAEGEPGRPFRWSGPGPSVAFDLPLAPRRRFVLEIGLYVPRPIGDLAVTVDGTDVPVAPVWHDEHGASLSVPVATADGRTSCRVELTCGAMRLAGEGDPRMVGYVVHRAEVRRADLV